MKIGDRVTYLSGNDPLVGTITGETAKSWKILFDDGKQKTVRKTSIVSAENTDPVEEVVKEPVTEEPVATDVTEEPV